ncbi:MAG: hypothetical protein U0269_00695 [Polyangiales bacterium]
MSSSLVSRAIILAALLGNVSACARPSTTLLIRVRTDFAEGEVSAVRAVVAWIDRPDSAFSAMDAGVPTYELTGPGGEIVRRFPGTIVVAPRPVRDATPVDVTLRVTPSGASTEPFDVRARVRFAREKTTVLDVFVPSVCSDPAVRDRCAEQTRSTGVEHTCAGEGEDPCVPLVTQEAVPYVADASVPSVDVRLRDIGLDTSIDAGIDAGIDAPLDVAVDASDVTVDVPVPCMPACNVTERCVAGRCYPKPNRLAVGDAHSCAGTGFGVYCWGRNVVGQLGRGTTAPFSATPAFVLSSNNPSPTTTSRADHTCFSRNAGQAFCWGNNSSGQFGDGTMIDQSSPTLVTGSALTTAVAVGARHSCFLEAVTVVCAGANDQAQLGQGIAGPSSPTVVAVRGIGGTPSQLSAGDDFTCATTTGVSAGVYCWGANTNGQIGNGTTTRAAMAVQVLSATLATTAAGARHACAFDTANTTLRCWGDNTDGQLGDGTTLVRPSPVAVALPAGVLPKKIAAGRGHTCMVDTNDALWCWGRNAEGQLGIGSRSASELTPQRVRIGPVDEVQCGSRHTCARTIGSDVWCWGDNSEGQLGDGTTVPSAIPVSVLPFP